MKKDVECYLPDVMNSFAKKIHYHRRRKNITQEALAEYADVHINTLSNIERGVAIPSFTVAMQIANVLDISLDELLIQMAKDVVI